MQTHHFTGSFALNWPIGARSSDSERLPRYEMSEALRAEGTGTRADFCASRLAPVADNAMDTRILNAVKGTIARHPGDATGIQRS
jgi:hypothetical protein